MSESDTSICRVCREPLKPGAKKCPHCHEWLAWWSAKQPAVQLCFFVIAIGALFVPMTFFIRSLNPPAMFPAHQKELSIVESKMLYEDSTDKPKITLVGKIKNNGNLTWNDITLEVQFFDASNTMVDTITDNKYNIIIAPHGEASFRLGALAMLSKDKYVTHKVKVTWAKTKGAF